jgi:hypothetical protein
MAQKPKSSIDLSELAERYLSAEVIEALSQVDFVDEDVDCEVDFVDEDVDCGISVDQFVVKGLKIRVQALGLIILIVLLLTTLVRKGFKRVQSQPAEDYWSLNGTNRGG